jgi:chaperonin GroEL
MRRRRRSAGSCCRTRPKKSRSGAKSLRLRSAPKGQGLNVDSGQVEDLVKSRIIDPTMVTRSALQNAASIAKNILTTEAIVAEAPEKNAVGMGSGMGGGMGDMGGMM